MKPTVGRIVHFKVLTCLGEEIRPAIVTHVWTDTMVNLHVVHDGPAGEWRQSVQQGTGVGEWSWPPRE